MARAFHPKRHHLARHAGIAVGRHLLAARSREVTAPPVIHSERLGTKPVAGKLSKVFAAKGWRDARRLDPVPQPPPRRATPGVRKLPGLRHPGAVCSRGGDESATCRRESSNTVPAALIVYLGANGLIQTHLIDCARIQKRWRMLRRRAGKSGRGADQVKQSDSGIPRQAARGAVREISRKLPVI